MKNEEAIAAKKREIERYDEILQKYRASRWYDQGRRHMADLKEELRLLEEAQE
jgi:hypothetical protein